MKSTVKSDIASTSSLSHAPFIGGLATILCFASLASCYEILSNPIDYNRFENLAPIFLKAALQIAACFLVSFGLLLPLRAGRFSPFRPTTVAALASFWFIAFTLHETAQLYDRWLDTPPAILWISCAALALVPTIFLAAIGFWVRRSPRLLAFGRSLFLFAPLAAVSLVLYTWMNLYLIAFQDFYCAFYLIFTWIVVLIFGLAAFWALEVRRRSNLVFIISGFLMLAVAGFYGAIQLASPLHRRLTSAPLDIPRVVLITIDTLRADVIRCIDPENGTDTPNFDALAEDSILFTQAMAPAPWTPPSMATIMTGLHPEAHRHQSETRHLSSRLHTLAERMRESGYWTSAFAYNSYVSEAYQFDQGFDEFHFLGNPAARLAVNPIFRYANRWPRYYYGKPSTTNLADTSCHWLDRHHERPFFLWTHYIDPHTPYQAPAKYGGGSLNPTDRIRRYFERGEMLAEDITPTDADAEEWPRAPYEAEVRYVDDALGQVLSKLKEHNLYDDALVIVTSDHGEELYDHGGVYHGHTLYQELLRVPLFIKLPRSRHARVVTERVAMIDLMPTLLDICGIPYEVEELSGRSIASAIKETKSFPTDRMIVGSSIYRGGDLRESIVIGDQKFIRFLEKPDREFYNLAADPGELENLYSADAAAVRALETQLDAFLEESQALGRRWGIDTESLEMELDPITRQGLQALGYL